MIGRIQTAVLGGLASHLVEVEVKAQNGLPRFSIIGFADNAVREARDRVLAALSQCGCTLPDQVLVSLAPAELKKEGAGIDLAIALGVLAAAGAITPEALQGKLFLGELGLNGEIKKVRGCITHTARAAQEKISSIVVPKDNYPEARLLSGIDAIPAQSLQHVVQWLRGEIGYPAEEFSHEPPYVEVPHCPDFNSIVGQEGAKRALMVAAAGAHNALMIGPPGCGKTMLAEGFRSLLPNLHREEMLEVAGIHSIAGLSISQVVQGVRPYRAPHYGMSEAGLVGGGALVRPGEVSLAHRGVLFLDELPEFRRDVIEALRIPLESGLMRISRAKGSVSIPARFQLLAAMNPCPCGRLGSRSGGCSCSHQAVQTYLRKLSLPILDRIDLHVTLEPVEISDLISTRRLDATPSEISKQQIVTVREVQFRRQGKLNAELSGSEALALLEEGSEAAQLMLRISDSFKVSARGYTRLLKVARTIADLKGSDVVQGEDIAEAFGYRNIQILERFNQSVEKLRAP